jgi:hypothetical protein
MVTDHIIRTVMILWTETEPDKQEARAVNKSSQASAMKEEKQEHTIGEIGAKYGL